MNKIATSWDTDSLHQHASNTPFVGATRHWQDKALACFVEAGFPTRHIETWRYTDLTGLLGQDFLFDNASPDPVDLSAYTIPDSYRVVFINGVFHAELSTVSSDVVILSLRELLKTADETLLRELRIELDLPYFACLNSALMRQGCYIKLQPNSRLDKPLHVLHVTTQIAQPTLQTVRFFIDADKNAEVTILEEHVGLGDSIYFNNVVTQMNLNFDSRVRYYKFQRDAQSAYHFATTIVSLSADSQFHYSIISDGAKQNREDLFVRHYERGSHAQLVGFYNAKGEGQTIHHTRVDHFKGMCSTNQDYKGMTRDSSKAVFDGKMIAHPGAQKSTIHQTNHNLLLSNKAEIDAKPNLEVYTDDIIASHGATVGQLDPHVLFYLCSRGISQAQAREMLMSAFVSSIFEKMPQNNVTAYLQTEFLGALNDA